MARRTISRRQHAIMRGYRSGLEQQISGELEAAGLPVNYETQKIDFIWPQRPAKYTPDFWVATKNGGFFIETKGRWCVEDRQKHLIIRDQCPDVEIRFIFSNANAPLYKGSKTSYAQFCERHGFKYAHKSIPAEWLKEGENDNDPERKDTRPSQAGRVD